MAQSPMIGTAGHFAIHLDVQVTRRKWWFVATDPEGNPIYYARHISEVMGWLDLHGVHEYVLVPSEQHDLGQQLNLISIRKEEQWQK
jgi:hypothetical protein